ncbi:MAG TPA: hypothetical protein VFC78_12740 [Tepidisphaeraceae bacterium]|nr:hypothetical protein [Tepidisphaeraceae bacterium]
MKTSFLTAAACQALLPLFVQGQVAVQPPGQAVAQQAAPPAGPPRVDPALAALPLHKLIAVRNVHERRTHWQKAADEAVSRIEDSKLKAVVAQRIAKLAPTIAEALIGHPGQSAMLTVAVYQDRKAGTQALAAVAYEGLGRDLNPSFYPRVLADLPQAPGGQEDQTQKFQLDANATSYLCFFLDHGDLKAGEITQAQMKQSLGLAIEQAHRDAAPPANVAGAGNAAAAQARAAQAQAAAQAAQQQAIAQQIRQARLDQQQQDLNQQAANQANATNFSSPYWNSGGWGGIPYGAVGGNGVGFGGVVGYGGTGYGGIGYGGAAAYGWSPWLAYAPGQNGYPANQPPHVVAPGYMPNVVAQRDPRTGQPITPTIVPAPGSPAGAIVPPYNVTPAQRDPKTGQPITPTPPDTGQSSSSGSDDSGNP